jgi:hypothetical protein
VGKKYSEFLNLEFIGSLFFLLDNIHKVWFDIIIKRLVTSPKLLPTSHGQQHFFLADIDQIVLPVAKAESGGFFHLQKIAHIMDLPEDIPPLARMLVPRE